MLRTRAGAAALLVCAQARPPLSGQTFAGTMGAIREILEAETRTKIEAGTQVEFDSVR